MGFENFQQNPPQQEIRETIGGFSERAQKEERSMIEQLPLGPEAAALARILMHTTKTILETPGKIVTTLL